MPKDILPINYSDVYENKSFVYWSYDMIKKTYKDYFENFIEIFKTNISEKLKCFKIK